MPLESLALLVATIGPGVLWHRALTGWIIATSSVFGDWGQATGAGSRAAWRKALSVSRPGQAHQTCQRSQHDYETHGFPSVGSVHDGVVSVTLLLSSGRFQQHHPYDRH